MKQFIYLDTDVVNSIIAQKDKGLVLETVNEQEDTSGKEKSQGGSITVNGSVGGGLWKIAQAQAELQGSGELSIDSHSQTVLKEIATKTLHDAAFDIAYKQIKAEYDMNPENADLGAYVELGQIFDFVDLTYIEGLFSEGGFIDFLKKTEKEKIGQQFDKRVEELSREQQRQNSADIKKEKKKLLEASDKQYDDIVEIIKVIRQMIPYNRMLVSPEGYLIPLEDKYFRDNPQTMGFKHGGYITCVGYITNVIGETNGALSGNVFSQLQTLVNQSLVSILPTKEKDLFVVHPIAIYYGE